MLLFLNDIGTWEVLLILVFILIFFGSKSIPGLARTFGRTIRQVKDASAEIQNEIKKSGMDIKKDLNLEGMVRETAEDIKRPLDQYAADVEKAMKYQPKNSQAQVKKSPPNTEITTEAPNKPIDQLEEKPENESKEEK